MDITPAAPCPCLHSTFAGKEAQKHEAFRHKLWVILAAPLIESNTPY